MAEVKKLGGWEAGKAGKRRGGQAARLERRETLYEGTVMILCAGRMAIHPQVYEGRPLGGQVADVKTSLRVSSPESVRIL
jgi:hypothetical protein